MKSEWKKRWRSKIAGMLVAACLTVVMAGKAGAVATSSATLDIVVTIQQNLSVLISTSTTYLQYSTQSITWNLGTPNQNFSNDNVSQVGVATVTVQNNSGAQTERWQLSSSNTINSGGTIDWTLQQTTATSPGAEQFAVQAVFGSSITALGGCPHTGATDWGATYATPLTYVPAYYTNAQFADTTLTGGVGGNTYNPDCTGPGGSCTANGDMFANSIRTLCWRVIMPQTTSKSAAQVIPVTVTAAAP